MFVTAAVLGDIVTAIAMTEPGAGSDLQGMRTVATKDGDDYILNGSKTYITNGWHADMVIVCAKTDVNAKGTTNTHALQRNSTLCHSVLFKTTRR